jgi:phage FluMu gp28-like protein
MARRQPVPDEQDPALAFDAEGAEERLEEAAAGAPDAILLPYQQAWVSDDAPVKVHEKSRRIGISWAEAADAALYASRSNGASVYYMAYNQDMTRGFVEDVAWWAGWFDMAASAVQEREEVFQDGDKERSVKVFQVEFDSGNVVQALSSNPRNLRSKGAPGERVIFDEYAFHDHQGELLKAGMAFLTWGGQVRVISTHNGVENDFNQIIQDARAGRNPYSVHRVTFEDAIEQGLYRRICLMKGEDWSLQKEVEWEASIREFYGDDADEELDVIPQRSGGRFFSRVLVESVTDEDIPVCRLQLEDDFAMKPDRERATAVAEWLRREVEPVIGEAVAPGLASVMGADFGRHADLSVFWPGQVQSNLTRRVLCSVELSNVPFREQELILEYLLGHLPRLRHVSLDAGGLGMQLAERAAQLVGWVRTSQIKIDKGFYQENFPRYKSGIEDGKILLPASADVVGDHMDVVRERGVPKVPAQRQRQGEKGEGRHGDAAIAGLMLWHASEQEGAPLEEWESTGARATTGAMQDFAEGGRQRLGFGEEGTIERGWGTVSGPLEGMQGFA